MWDTPFDPLMLDGRVLIFCPDSDRAPELMELLGEYGVKWEQTDCLAHHGNSHWDAKKEQTCYRVHFRHMGYSSIDYYERNGQFRDYIKCTFYGAETSDFEVATDSELRSLLGV